MSRVNFRKAVNYPPWIGKNYGSSENIRLLIIGRSYYDARYRDKTIESYISDLIKNKVSDPFYTALELVLSDSSHWKSGLGTSLKLDRKKFWNSICYHQFLQGILHDGYSDPGREMWKQGQEIYKEVLIALQPDIIVMAGKDVYDNMPTLGGRNGKIYSWQAVNMKTWILNLGATDCQIAGMTNPRDSSFNTDVWKEIYVQFMSDYRNSHKLTDFSSI
ncbi:MULTISPECIES: hypothetical protein [unclassified Oceanispirochaeta]|uniref:hypothetical protein n=1 Tax=unclassified Oceanispirochaeta TaxID=2635722 RepID=UPI000E09D14E|nr:MULTISPECIES: hypothetical protein [unclassified Oceanispirochaeta]MBF9014237.1 hypothetical protein [Oceanispirochaeta sp. M2]NPD71123.1 hypothetical protein [Oceanispirochaeta sp. M1]RDG33517.1 hypothetical protein DV872_03330 [Oceanispirochaeta sp. M1]